MWSPYDRELVAWKEEYKKKRIESFLSKKDFFLSE